MGNYFTNIKDIFSSLMGGMRLTFTHLIDARKSHKPTNVQAADYFLEDKGIVTLSYPYQAISLPDNGRYRLHNEIDDCIVCDKCAVVCPVDCIAIETIKSPEALGETSDGSVKRLWASTFDIDMAKCCFCGLCTTVCPTECLTMTKVYDFSEVDIRNMNYHYTNLTPELADDKRKLYDRFVKEKEELKKQQAEAKAAAEKKPELDLQNIPTETPIPAAVKTPFRPVFKPNLKKDEEPELSTKPVDNSENGAESVVEIGLDTSLSTKQEFNLKNEEEKNETETKLKMEETPKPKAIAKSVFKPVIKKPNPPSQA